MAPPDERPPPDEPPELLPPPYDPPPYDPPEREAPPLYEPLERVAPPYELLEREGIDDDERVADDERVVDDERVLYELLRVGVEVLDERVALELGRVTVVLVPRLTDEPAPRVVDDELRLIAELPDRVVELLERLTELLERVAEPVRATELTDSVRDEVVEAALDTELPERVA